MRTILVDDEIMAVKVFRYETAAMENLEVVGIFQNGLEALEYAQKNLVDLAFLDIEMEEMDGIALGNELKKIYPDIMLIYTTGHEKYAMDAFRLHAAAFLLKPYSSEDLSYAVDTARLLSKRRKRRFFARTFGHFDLFVDGKPIMFKSAKAKELLALLIDRRGGTVTSDQIIGVLWEDRPNDEATQNLCSKIVRTLRKELEGADAQGLLESSRGIHRVDTELFDCDFYDLLDGDRKVTDQFMGEYMLDYSWAENRMALLLEYIQ